MGEYIPFFCILGLIVIDYVTGIVAALVTDSFSSVIMRRGLWHKLSYLIAVVVGIIVEQLSSYYDLGFVFAGSIVALIVVWIVITEVGSILENLVKINPNLADNAFMRIFATREKESEIEKDEMEVELSEGKHAA